MTLRCSYIRVANRKNLVLTGTQLFVPRTERNYNNNGDDNDDDNNSNNKVATTSPTSRDTWTG
jgi:hypothetical protein